MKNYRLYHRILKEFRDVKADSATEACQSVGWMIGDVWVRELTPMVRNPASESGHSGGGWKYITPKEVDYGEANT